MENKRICKGCGTSVAKLITCGTCGILSHPGCIIRTNHPQENGSFKNCKSVDRFHSDDLMQAVRDIVRNELENFRKMLCEEFGIDLRKIKDDVRELSRRMDSLEERFAKTVHDCPEEELFQEIRERDRRASNIIMFDVEESVEISPAEHSGGDSTLAREIFRSFMSDAPHIRKTARIGKKTRDQSRPLCVTLSSREQVYDVMRMKHKYSGPVGFSQDRTLKQRAHLKNLRARLKSLSDAGDNSKTIKYTNGVPRLVDVRHASVSKNE